MPDSTKNKSSITPKISSDISSLNHFRGKIASNVLIFLCGLISICNCDFEYLIDRFPSQLVKSASNSYAVPLNQLFWASATPATEYSLN
jgi:hypothetical protein